MKRITFGAAIAVMAASPAMAEVRAAEAHGLVVATSVAIAAPPEAVYAALITPGRWWNAAHSWSGQGANMTLDPVPGGCFCEKIPANNGAAEHLRVVMVIPNKLLRLRGALGPFQAMGVEGALTWELKSTDKGTEITQTYSLGGMIPGGGKDLAPVVDQVMSGQMAGLKTFVEKGR